MNADHKLFWERIAELAEFGRQHGGRCFAGWPPETLLLYVCFHALAGTLFVVRRDGKPAALGIAWPMQPDAATPDFDWRRATPGPALMVREVIGDRASCRAMFRQARARWPFIQQCYAYRHRRHAAKLTLFHMEHIERFCHV